MRISDWSSDVCSSDLCRRVAADIPATVVGVKVAGWFAGEFKQCVVGNGLAGGSGQHGRSRDVLRDGAGRSEEHTSELQSLMRISYAVFCLKKQNTNNQNTHDSSHYNSEVQVVQRYRTTLNNNILVS